MATNTDPFTFSLPPVLVKEVDDLVGASNKYRNRSHFAQTAMENLLAEEAKTSSA